MTYPEPIRVTLSVTDVLEAMEIAYLIGGSLASTVHGIGRATMDADIIADLQLAHIATTVQTLGDEFFIDENMIQTAVLERGSFSIIHRETIFKVDMFVTKGREFERSQLERRVYEVILTEPERGAYFASPEDIVLAKLDLYKQGAGVSDRQWRDVINVVRVQGQQLDVDYLWGWADRLGLGVLIERALDEAV